jgi:alpha-tubulin suppressor-like RCC1 family protein
MRRASSMGSWLAVVSIAGCASPAAPRETPVPAPPTTPPATLSTAAPEPTEPVHLEPTPAATLALSEAMSCVVDGLRVICWGGREGPREEPSLAGSVSLGGHGGVVCGLDAQGTTLRCTAGPSSFGGPTTEAVNGAASVEVDGDGAIVREREGRFVRAGGTIVETAAGTVAVRTARGTRCALADTGALTCTADERASFVIEGVLDFGFQRSGLCVLRRDAVECGSLATWRSGEEPERFVGTRGASRLVSGAGHVCVLAESGTVLCVGDNERGELGRAERGARAAELAPVLDVRGATELASGAHHTCARTADGVRCWGDDSASQVSGERVTYAEDVLTGVTLLASSPGGSCAVRTDGSLWCWGANGAGQLGNGSASSQLVPTRVLLPGVGAISELARPSDSTCALSAGRVACFGGSSDRERARPDLDSITDAVHIGGFGRSLQVVRAGGEVSSFDAGSGARLEGGPHQAATGNVPSEVVQVVGSGSFVCALGREGRVWCWGGDFGGELGDGGDGFRGEPTLAIAPMDLPATSEARRDLHTTCDADCGVLEGVRSLTSYGRATCALLTNGRVACWGEGSHDRFAEHVRFTRRPVLLDGVEHARAVCVGGMFLCVANEDGMVRCRGRGVAGEARNAELAALDHVTQLSCGLAHACALREDGSVHCWGEPAFGRLGSAAVIRARAVAVAMP